MIENSVIVGNSSRGVYLGTGSFNNCLISGNGGAGIDSTTTGLAVRNCTIVGNKGIGCNVPSGGLSNCIIVLNWQYGISGTSNLKYNNVWGNLSGNYTATAPGETDTHENPLFAFDGYWDADEWVECEYTLKSVAGRWTELG